MVDLDKLPSRAGVYILYKKNSDGILEPAYIGQSSCIKRRVKEHTPIFDDISWIIIENKEDRLNRESELIQKYDPQGNFKELNNLGEHFGWLKHHVKKLERKRKGVKSVIKNISSAGEKNRHYRSMMEKSKYRINKMLSQINKIEKRLPEKSVKIAKNISDKKLEKHKTVFKSASEIENGGE